VGKRNINHVNGWLDCP